MMRYYGYGPMMGGSPFGWFFGLLFVGLLVALFVVLVIWAVRASHGHEGVHGDSGVPMVGGGHVPPSVPSAQGHDEAVAIAKRRFANGEITKEQYEEIIRTLG